MVQDEKAGNSSAEEDLDLVSKFLNNDPCSFEELVLRYETRIYNHCLKFLSNKEDAEDALQETFLHAFRSLENFRKESSFSTWLFKIATNTSLMKLRKRRNRKLYSLDDPLEIDGSIIKKEVTDWSHNPDFLHGKENMMALFDEALSSLSEEKRIVFYLKDVQGFSNAEISKMLGISVSAIKSRLHRARLVIRKSLSKYFDNAFHLKISNYEKYRLQENI